MAEKKLPLLCMRLAEMDMVHPLMSRSENCERCGAQLGIYPSGQNILAQYGRERIELVCNRCLPDPDIMAIPPDTFADYRASIPNPEKSGRN